MKLPMSFLKTQILVFLVIDLWLLEARPVIMNGDRTSAQNVDNQEYYDTESFSKLKLDASVFYGSRWVLDNMQRNEPVTVMHTIQMRSASVVQIPDMKLRVDIEVLQRWMSPDLEFPVGIFKTTDPDRAFVTTDGRALETIWSPNSIVSSCSGSNVRTEASPVKIVYLHRHRLILFKSRMSCDLHCTSNFQWYPADVQTCHLKIKSFKGVFNVRYNWSGTPLHIFAQQLMQYELILPPKVSEGIMKLRIAEFPFVSMEFTLVRMLGNNLIQVYTPTLIVVILSWFSFRLGLEDVSARIGLLVTCMLTLVTMHGSLKNTIPPVEYVTMMDVWMVTCMAMVFGATLEFVVLKYAHGRYETIIAAEEKRMEKESLSRVVDIMQTILEELRSSGPNHQWNQNKSQTQGRWDCSPTNLGRAGNTVHEAATLHILKNTGQQSRWKFLTWQFLDQISRVLYPAVFLVFNIIYWPLLLA